MDITRESEEGVAMSYEEERKAIRQDIEHNENRISELEKKMGVFDKIDIVQTQIDEQEKFNERTINFENDLGKQIDELKEFDKGCQKWSVIIEEVLREFFEFMYEYSIRHPSNRIDIGGYAQMFIRKLGGSERIIDKVDKYNLLNEEQKEHIENTIKKDYVERYDDYWRKMCPNSEKKDLGDCFKCGKPYSEHIITHHGNFVCKKDAEKKDETVDPPLEEIMREVLAFSGSEKKEDIDLTEYIGFVDKDSSGEKEHPKADPTTAMGGKTPFVKEHTAGLDSKPEEPYNRIDQCKKCVHEYIKNIICYKGGYQTLSEKKPCKLFEPKSKPEEPKYLCLKMDKQLDIIKLRDLLNEIIDGDDALGLSVSWYEVSEALLKADGSWDKEPKLYHKYNIVKREDLLKPYMEIIKDLNEIREYHKKWCIGINEKLIEKQEKYQEKIK